MSDGRHAEVLQVIPRQLAEDLAVDLIVTERRLVFAESKASQPVSHVHSHVPNTCDAHSFWDFDGSGCTRCQKSLKRDAVEEGRRLHYLAVLQTKEPGIGVGIGPAVASRAAGVEEDDDGDVLAIVERKMAHPPWSRCIRCRRRLD